MADFEALNELRSRTLRQLREMVAGEPALWARSFDPSGTSPVPAHIESNRARFRALWNQHQEVRRQMVEAGFMPPPVQSDDPFDSPLEDPVRHKIEDTLKAELDAARAAYYGASQEFRLFVAQGTGLPAPDGNLRARQIAAAHSAALHKYTSAIRRFNAFLADGKLPTG
ncbi:MAG: hypothetical protein ABSC05_27570 [Candidatus Solibacter sp.]|jgi:hypothetical protein